MKIRQNQAKTRRRMYVCVPRLGWRSSTSNLSVFSSFSALASLFNGVDYFGKRSTNTWDFVKNVIEWPKPAGNDTSVLCKIAKYKMTLFIGWLHGFVHARFKNTCFAFQTSVWCFGAAIDFFVQ